MEEVDIEDIAHALSLMCRFGGHCKEFYSVAEHSVRCAVAAKDSKEDRNLQFKCLMHDAAEAYCVDVPRPLKLNLVGYKEIEHKVQSVIEFKYRVYNSSGYTVYDEILLATEKRDLMPSHSAEWGWLPMPLADRIVPWTPRQAEKKFLQLFNRLLQ
jgi:hypothetical protein